MTAAETEPAKQTTRDPPDLLIFDNDGVLVDTEMIANRILADLLTGYGLPTTVDEAISLYLGTSLSYVRSAAGRRLGIELPTGFEELYHDRLFTEVSSGLVPVPGIEDALPQIPVPFCVASSGSLERIEKTLEAVGLWERFVGRAFSAEEVGSSKPAPDVFLYAAERLGYEPSACAVIEDSPWGIEAANRAGMTSWGFAYRTPARLLLEATGGILTAMGDLGRVWARAAPQS